MSQGILSGLQIQKELKLERILIDPFDPKQLNPASYDLTLGKEVRVYSNAVYIERRRVTPEDVSCGKHLHQRSPAIMLDPRSNNDTESFQIGDSGWLLKPGIGYLMHTQERVGSKFLVPVIDGKSSLGRLFIQVHATAGYGDPNFFGQFTLEVTVTHPVRVYAGMRIAQVRFHTVLGDIKPYEGNYTGSDALGATPSKSWRQFSK